MICEFPRLLQEYKTRHDGVLPSNLYSKTNAQLQELYIELTDDKYLFTRQTFPKEVLVARIIKLTGIPHEITKCGNAVDASAVASVGEKRKADTPCAGDGKKLKPEKKVKYNVLPKITATQLTHMKKVMKFADDEADYMTHDRHLKPLWKSLGMTTDYPKMTGKELVVERMKVFAENNMRYHGHLVG